MGAVMKALTSIVGIAALATLAVTPSFAADMSPPVLKAPPPAPVYSWTGFYLNGGGGYGYWEADTTTVLNPFFPGAGTCVLCTDQRQGGNGWLGRLGGGFDWQVTPNIVIGAFGDWSPESLRGNIQDQGPFFVGTITETDSWAGGVRAGWLVTPQVLTYVNGGYSGTRFGSAGMVSAFNGAPALGAGGVQFATPAFTKSGWFIGGGYETPIAAFIPGIPTGLFWRTEYRYESYNSSSLTDCAGVPSAATCDNSITFRPTNQTIVSELVWRFNWAAPGVHW